MANIAVAQVDLGTWRRISVASDEENSRQNGGEDDPHVHDGCSLPSEGRVIAMDGRVGSGQMMILLSSFLRTQSFLEEHGRECSHTL